MGVRHGELLIPKPLQYLGCAFQAIRVKGHDPQMPVQAANHRQELHRPMLVVTA